MAAGLLAKPGDEFGPCKDECKHADCARTRDHAARICHHCDKPIDYMTRFYDVGVPGKVSSVHALCEEVAIERDQKARDMDLKLIRFGFDEVGPFNGMTDGTHWNGWLNIWVMADEHRAVVAAMKSWRGDHGLEQCEEDAEFDTLQATDGVVSYANGYTTSEWMEKAS